MTSGWSVPAVEQYPTNKLVDTILSAVDEVVDGAQKEHSKNEVLLPQGRWPVMGLKEIWSEFIAAFRAERQGGEAAEASRRRTDTLRRELADDREGLRIARRWAKATSPAELAEVQKEVVQFVLREPEAPITKDAPIELQWSQNPVPTKHC